MDKKIISFKVSEAELFQLDSEIKKTGLTRSDYMRKAIFNNESITILYRQREFYQGLCKINREISTLEQQTKNVDFSGIRKEVMEACQLLTL